MATVDRELVPSTVIGATGERPEGENLAEGKGTLFGRRR